MRNLYCLLAAVALFPAAALASSSVICTTEPQSKWIPEAEMKNRIAAMGYKFDAFKKTSGGCYEIYGRDPAGRRVEVYFDPVTGAVAKSSK